MSKLVYYQRRWQQSTVTEEMIDFPYSETSGWFGIQFAIIGSVLSIVFLFVARLFGFRVLFTKMEPGWYPAFLLIIPVVIVFGFAVAIPGFWTVRQFRAFDLNSVGSLKIRETDKTDGKVVQYSDVAEIGRVLLMMQSCQGVSHDHDELYDGYAMELVKPNGESANLYLKVYRKSSTSSRNAVIAAYSNLDAGEFECPDIQNWVALNIDPLFGRTVAP